MLSGINIIFYKIVYMSIIASCIGIVILIIRKIFSEKISPKWVSRLWILVLIALLCPVQISSVFSIYNYIPNGTAIPFQYARDEIPSITNIEVSEVAQQKTKQTLNEKASNNPKEQIQENKKIEHIKSLIIDVVLPFFWVTIAGILIIMYIITYVIFAITLRKNKSSKNERVLLILERCKKKLKISRKIKVTEQDRVKTPSLFGIFHINIILPDNINQLTDFEIKSILMHELSHYKRRDNILKQCLTLVKYIYFFNPVIYIIYKQIVKDMEVATDEMAIKGFDKENKKEYCRTLIKLTDEYAQRNFLVKTLAISDNKNNLERRIIMIKRSDGFIKHKGHISIMSIIVILVLSATFLTKPKVKGINNIQDSLQILSQEEALNLGKEKFEQIKNYYWSWMTNHIERDGPNSKVKEEYANNIKNMCTENAFNQFLEYWDIDVPGDGYYYLGEGIGANPRYDSDELTIEHISEKEIVLIDTVKYDDEPAKKDNKFVLVKVGENWLLEDFTSPY